MSQTEKTILIEKISEFTAFLSTIKPRIGNINIYKDINGFVKMSVSDCVVG